LSVTLYTTVLLGSTVRVSAVIRDFDNSTLLDPSSHSLTIYDPNNILKSTVTSVTYESAGHYHYDYPVPASGTVGLWTLYWSITNAGTTSIQDTQFNVISK
jgi:uncharacterized protein YfaS (alpha-2-macroglobulin family)